MKSKEGRPISSIHYWWIL